MPTTVYQDGRVAEVELLDIFPASEGMISQYYGRIGAGKTYAATSDILDLLRRGKVVYANWKINYKGYDERRSAFRVFVSLVFPWIRRFYSFPKENLHYFEISNDWAVKQGYKDFDAWVATRTDCHIFADEGHVWVDSYAGTKMDMGRRTTITATRHFNRSINIISQRPTAIHVTMRANVNIFYRCTKIWQLGSLVRFNRTEFQDMQNENVNEDEEKELGRKYYWGSSKVFESYNTKYLRGDTKISQKVLFEAYELGYFKRVKLFFMALFRRNKLSTSYPQVDKKEKPLPISPQLLLLSKNTRRVPVLHVLTGVVK